MKCFVVRIVDGDNNDVDYRLNAENERAGREAALKEHILKFGKGVWKPYAEIQSVEEQPFDAEMCVAVEIYEW